MSDNVITAAQFNELTKAIGRLTDAVTCLNHNVGELANFNNHLGSEIDELTKGVKQLKQQLSEPLRVVRQ